MVNYLNTASNRGFNKALNSILAGIPAFGYLLYFIGRTYSIAYYSTIGIPIGIANLDFWDYLYSGAKGFNLIITVIFTLMFLGFLWYLTESRQIDYQNVYRRRDFIIPFGYLVYYAIVLVFLAAIGWFYPASKINPVYIIGSLMACLVVSGFSILILLDKALVARIKKGRVISRLFLLAVVIGLILFTYTSADSWGRYNGFIATDSLPLVEIYAPYQVIDDIQWEITSTNSFRTVDDLHLVFSNEQYLILESSRGKHNLYVIPTDDILSIKIIHPEK